MASTEQVDFLEARVNELQTALTNIRVNVEAKLTELAQVDGTQGEAITKLQGALYEHLAAYQNFTVQHGIQYAAATNLHDHIVSLFDTLKLRSGSSKNLRHEEAKHQIPNSWNSDAVDKATTFL